jgi:mxaJ protein
MGPGDHPLRGPGLALLLLLAACAPPQKALRVCADPNNLPFSNARGEGFENQLAQMVGRDLGRRVEYTWWAQRRGYVRNTLKARTCDLWPGVASQLERVATTRPYYRSTYVFVTRADGPDDVDSFDDPRLKRLRIGVQMIGDNAANTPPTHALARRGIVENVRGYMLYGDYTQANPPAEIVRAVDRGDIDVGLVWGPLAGYFAKRAAHPLRLRAVQPWLDGPQWPMVFDISMGVRKDDIALRDQVDRILERRSGEIRGLLQSYGVPTASGAGGPPPGP